MRRRRRFFPSDRCDRCFWSGNCGYQYSVFTADRFLSWREGRDAGGLHPVWTDHSGGASVFNAAVCVWQPFCDGREAEAGADCNDHSGVLNMTGDVLFMGVFHWGIAGAAMATAMGQIIGGTIPLVYFLRKNSSSLRLRRPKWDGGALRRACTNGVSELMSSISMSIVGMLYNAQLMRYAGENGVAAYGTIMYVDFIFLRFSSVMRPA